MVIWHPEERWIAGGSAGEMVMVIFFLYIRPQLAYVPPQDCLLNAGLFCNLVLVMWAFLVCSMSCLELTHFLHVAVFIPLLLPFLSRDSLQFYMVLCFNSHPGGDSISFSSTFLDVTVFVVQITEGFSRSQSRKEKKVTDSELHGTEKSSVPAVYFWGYFSWVWMCPNWSFWLNCKEGSHLCFLVVMSC